LTGGHKRPVCLDVVGVDLLTAGDLPPAIFRDRVLVQEETAVHTALAAYYVRTNALAVIPAGEEESAV